MKTFSSTTAENFLITRLGSGGIITNYHCTSACKHCLYACGPRREKDYIDSETLVENLKIIKSMGCRSVHVGGGEPFLNSEGLEMVLETSLGEGVSVEYVETNSSWFKDRKSAREDYGFEPDGAYLSKCHLCLEIRKFLMGLSNLNFEEFKPAGFYDNL